MAKQYDQILNEAQRRGLVVKWSRGVQAGTWNVQFHSDVSTSSYTTESLRNMFNDLDRHSFENRPA